MLEVIFLYIILHDDNSKNERFRTAMPDMKTCYEAINNSKMPVPKSGNDYEVMGVMFCGTGKFQNQYQSTWFQGGYAIDKN